MSEPKASLLPANSSPLEKALDLGFGTLLERVTPPFPAQTVASANGMPRPARRRNA